MTISASSTDKGGESAYSSDVTQIRSTLSCKALEAPVVVIDTRR